MKQVLPEFSEAELSRIIEMAWEDRTPFDAIAGSHGISESQVISLMRRHMKGFEVVFIVFEINGLLV